MIFISDYFDRRGLVYFFVLQSFVKWLLSAQVAALDELAVKEGGVGRCFAGIGELIAQDVVLWQAGKSEAKRS